MKTDVDPLDDDEPLSAAEIEMIRQHNPFYYGHACPIAELQAKLRQHLDRLSETRRPQLLTEDEGREFVIQSAEGYRALLQRLDYAECVVEIERGLEAVRRGDTIPLDEAFQQIRDGTWRDKDPRR